MIPPPIPESIYQAQFRHAVILPEITLEMPNLVLKQLPDRMNTLSFLMSSVEILTLFEDLRFV